MLKLRFKSVTEVKLCSEIESKLRFLSIIFIYFCFSICQNKCQVMINIVILLLVSDLHAQREGRYPMISFHLYFTLPIVFKDKCLCVQIHISLTHLLTLYNTIKIYLR